MLDKKRLLKNIDEAYAARARGDRKTVAKYLAPRSKYRLVGGERALPEIAEGSAKKSTSDLMDLFKFKSYKRLAAVVDGNTAAVHWRVKMSTEKGRTATVELFDLWKFDKAGKATSLTQFTDTALLERLVS